MRETNMLLVAAAEAQRESWRASEEVRVCGVVFRGGLVEEIARGAMLKDRGPHVDNWIGIPSPCGGITLKEDVVNYFGDEKDPGGSSACHMDPSLDSGQRELWCPYWLETELDGQKYAKESKVRPLSRRT